MSLAERSLQQLSQVAAIAAALSLSASVGGPVIRAVLGPPSGFGEDFTSRDAYCQALIVQLVFTIAGLALMRFIATKMKDQFHPWSLPNPVAVGAGFVIYAMTCRYLPRMSRLQEYHSVKTAIVLVVVVPLFFVMSSWLTKRIQLGKRDLSSQ